jgi:transcriptional regulator NrdR family protein
MIKVKVEKRDGSLEEFDPEKIKSVVVAAGLDEEKSKKLVANVSEWVKKYEGKTITSLQIRDQILVEMQKIDQIVAQGFTEYEKYKDKNFGVKY